MILKGLEKVMYWISESHQEARKNAQDYFGREPDKRYERKAEEERNSGDGSSCGSFFDSSDVGSCSGCSSCGGCGGCG